MGAVTAAKIMISTVKSKALEDKFKPASAIVNEVCVALNIILLSFLSILNFLAEEKNLPWHLPP